MQSLTRTLSATALAVAALAAATGVQAQSSSTSTSSASASSNYSFYAPGSRYLGLNIGQSDFSVPNGAGAFPSDNKDTSYNIYGGSYFNNNFGVELGYTDFGKMNRGGGQTEAEGINLSLVGRLPLSNSFNLLGKLGTTYGRTRVSALPASGLATGNQSDWGLSYGIGAEWAFTPAVSAVLAWDEHKAIGLAGLAFASSAASIRTQTPARPKAAGFLLPAAPGLSGLYQFAMK
ncbi:MAG: outer membrane beta-barrel protein [Polaromonas sp.]|nr:outer membrane beta-barrel protein [Polaromonas sp.]